MTSLDYRRLRQIELIHFAMRRFGRGAPGKRGHHGWKTQLAAELGIQQNEIVRWRLEDMGGAIQHRIEAWAEAIGFRSKYDAALTEFRHHEILLHRVLDPALQRRDELAASGVLRERVNKGALPLDENELDQLFAALGYESIGRG